MANPSDGWVNEHLVVFMSGLDDHGLVLFETLEPIGLILFRRETIAAVGSRTRQASPEPGLDAPVHQGELAGSQ